MPTRAQRLQELEWRLRGGEQRTMEDLAAALGVSVRTVRRDVRELQNSGVDIATDRGRGGGLRLRGLSRGKAMRFDLNETAALLVCLATALKGPKGPFDAALGPLLQKLLGGFEQNKRPSLRSFLQRFFVSYRPTVVPIEPVDEAVAAVVNRAFVQCQPLRIRYQAPSKPTSEREVEAHALGLLVPHWYILGYCRMRRAPRMFRLDRICSAEPRAGEFVPRPLEMARVLAGPYEPESLHGLLRRK